MEKLIGFVKKGWKPWQPLVNMSYSIKVMSMSTVKELQKVKQAWTQI